MAKTLDLSIIEKKLDDVVLFNFLIMPRRSKISDTSRLGTVTDLRSRKTEPGLEQNEVNISTLLDFATQVQTIELTNGKSTRKPRIVSLKEMHHSVKKNEK